MKTLFSSFILWLLTAMVAHPASMTIQSLSGPVTTTEINSFLTFMLSQTPPPTPWGALNGTTGDHNEWADGTDGRELEAMGEMFEVSSNLAILNLMISWADDCTSQRNDLLSAVNGGQRVMWTGLIDKVWCPNEPTSANAAYAGCENEDTEGHLGFCAELILQNPAIWNLTVPDGNPYGYGLTYFQRATNYLAKCDEANDEYSFKWFIQPVTRLIVAPTNSAWIAFDENVTANNRQMMFTSGFQRLAEAHEFLGDNPALMAQYDAIVQATVNQDLKGMINFHPYTTNGLPVYDWGYYPTTDAPEATEIHAEYDIIGLWRAFNRSVYGYTLLPLIPFANTLVNVIYLGTNSFAGNVDGSGGIQSPVYSGWILPADWNPLVYTVVAGAAYTNGWYGSSADIDAGILFMKNRRYQEFSITPADASPIVPAGAMTNYTFSIAPLGGFTNTVNLTVGGWPAGVTGSFNSAAVNLGSLNLVSTNVTLSVSIAASTPVGSYPLSIVGTSGGMAHTNVINLTIGDFSVSANPPSQTISPGQSVSYTVTVATNAGFSGSVLLGLSGLPPNCSASFNPALLNGTGSATLTVVASNSAVADDYPLEIFGTNGANVDDTSVDLQIVGTATPIWNGGSVSSSDWSDSANWNGVSVVPGDLLVFGGVNRLANSNDTAPGTIYSNLDFNAGAGAFILGGNPIAINGNITNNSSNPQTVDLGLSFDTSLIFNGASNTVIIGGGLTNTFGTSGATTITFAGMGVLTNLLNSTSNPGGTNVILLNSAGANWTLVNNASAKAMTVPWVFSIDSGTFNFGNPGSAPVLTSTTVNGVPNDNQIGVTAGATATLNMVNGTLTTVARLDTATALNSTGIVNQTGGTMNIGSQFQGANGQNPGETSLVNVSGGTLNINGGSGVFYVASRDAGTLTLSNTGVVNCGTLDLSRNAYGNTVSSVGLVNLNGGILMVTSVTNLSANRETGGSPTATFNFNGGTLLAKSGAAAGFFEGSRVTPITPISAIVKTGGAIINDGGNTITILEPLQHDTTLGGSPDGGLTKIGSGTLILTAAGTYTGNTVVSNGTLSLAGNGSFGNSSNITVNADAILNVSGRSDDTLTLDSGQTLFVNGTVNGNVTNGFNSTLSGNGVVTGNLTLNAGGILSPGTGPGAIGTLTVNGTAGLQGVTCLKIDKSLSPANDMLVANTIQYGGTLVVTNLGPALAAGDGFKLFNAANYSGVFTNITPTIPGLNLAWNTNGLGNGLLSVVSQPATAPKFSVISVSSNYLVLTCTNGVPNSTCYLLASTNLAWPFSQWPVIATNTFDGNGNFSFTNSPSVNAPQIFYLLEVP